MDLEKKLQEIIERKYDEVKFGKDPNAKFAKIADLEGNAVGQIGEEYAKFLIRQFTEIIDEGVVHSDYDIKTKNGILVEVKTARKGRNNTFQFNGIDPRAEYNYLLCLGICEDAVFFRIFGNEVKFNRKENSYYIEQQDFKRKLAAMNVGGTVNYKLTLNVKYLYDISEISEQLRLILH